MKLLSENEYNRLKRIENKTCAYFRSKIGQKIKYERYCVHPTKWLDGYLIEYSNEVFTVFDVKKSCVRYVILDEIKFQGDK